MSYFEKKLNNHKDFLYQNYLKLLEKNNTDLESDLDRIINIEYDEKYNPIIPNYLTIFIKDFYEIKEINYDHIFYTSENYSHYNPIMDEINKKNVKIQEKINEINYKKGLKNYSIIIFDYFPIDIVKCIIQIFINKRIYNDYIYMEVKKYLYSHWKDDLVKDNVYQITNILIETANFSKEEYLDIMTNPKNHKYNREKHYIYYVFWLYCFYPLIEGYAELILKLVNLVYLNDAQDELMDGIERIESTKLLPFYKKFILTVWKSCNYKGTYCFDLFGGGTGSFSQNVRIIKKLKKDLGWDIFTDDDLKEFWLDFVASSIIEYIKRDVNENSDDENNNENNDNENYKNLLADELIKIKYIELDNTDN